MELIILIALIFGLVISVTTTFKIGPLSITFKKNIKSALKDMRDIQLHYLTEINKAENSILKSQMDNGESTIARILQHIINEGYTDPIELQYLKTTSSSMIKTAMLSNGFSNLDAPEFSRYVGRKIDLFRDHFQITNTEFVNSPAFSEEIGNIFNHARSCSDYWHYKIKELKEECDKALDRRL